MSSIKQKYISTEDLASQIENIQNEISKHNVTYIVMDNLRPSFKISSIKEESPQKKKYTKKDIRKFVFSSKNKEETNLSENYKKYLYGI